MRSSRPADAAQLEGSSWTRDAEQQRGSSWTRDAEQQRGSSWTRVAGLLRGSSWTRDAEQQRGSSWTRDAEQQRGSSWTRDAEQQRGSSWTSNLPKSFAAGIAALAMGVAGAPAFAGGSEHTAAPQLGGSLLLRTDGTHLADVAAAVTRHGGTVLRTLSAVGILEVTLPSDQVSALRHTAGVLGASRNGSVKLQSDAYDPAKDKYSLTSTLAATGIRGAKGYAATGAGVDVAIVDSGVSPVAGLNGDDKVVHGPDLSFESQNPATRYLDTFGHGTHLAGIIAGHDAGASPTSIAAGAPAFLGVAPNARIVSVKVADAHGNSDVSQVIAGIDWVVEHAHDRRANLNVRVLNLSFGTDANVSYLRDPLSQAVEVAWQHGIVVVVSAGNRGTTLGHLTDPAMDPFVVAVAAGDDAGGVADFSSRGNGVRNPDVTAPGVHVPSLNVPGSFIDQTYGGTAMAGARLIKGSGTSQAAAFVSGLVADMLQKNPTLTPDQAKARMVRTATPLLGVPATAGGAGLVSARAIDDSAPSAAAPPVVTSPVTASPVTASPVTSAESDTATATISAPAAAAVTAPARVPASDSEVDSRPLADSTQTFAHSSGDGPLNGSRGSYILVNNQVALDGEVDIFGHAWNSAALAKKREQVTIWNRGIYNGSAWGGSAWGGSAWGGSAWGGSAWGGSAWGGSAWGGSAWGSGTWNGSAWGGSAWGGSAWGGSAWGGSAWGGSAWGGSAWGGSAWGGSAWGSSFWG